MNEEELINYFQEKINNGNHKIFTDISDASYKTIDAINCIIGLQQENKQLKEQLKQRDEDITFCLASIKQEMEMSNDSRTRKEMTTCYEILQKYKGDSNDKEGDDK